MVVIREAKPTFCLGVEASNMEVLIVAGIAKGGVLCRFRAVRAIG